MVTFLLSIAMGSLLGVLGLLCFRLGAHREYRRARGSERVRMRIVAFAAITGWLQLAFSSSQTPSFRPRVSLSFALIRLAVRRLPEEMTEAEKDRWAREMRADAESLPKWRLRRIRFAFNLWRKGAPEMPVGQDPAAGPARDQ